MFPEAFDPPQPPNSVRYDHVHPFGTLQRAPTFRFNFQANLPVRIQTLNRAKTWNRTWNLEPCSLTAADPL